MAIKGIELANELRKLADAVAKLDDLGNYLIPAFYFNFRYGNEEQKNGFINFARVMPKPLEKKYEGNDFVLEYNSEFLRIHASIERDKVCKIVKPAQPAEYECEPLLSQDEIEGIGIEDEDEVQF